MFETVIMSQTYCIEEAIILKYEVCGSKEKIMNCGREPAQEVGKRDIWRRCSEQQNGTRYLETKDRRSK